MRRLISTTSIDAMAKAFEESDGPLAWRIIAGMQAAEKAGGDKRGKQSAAILVVREKGGYGGCNDRLLDFRVDDHPDPVPELARILALRLRKKYGKRGLTARSRPTRRKRRAPEAGR